MSVFLQYATDSRVRIHVATKVRKQCLFCLAPTVIGSHYVALRGITEDRAPCTSYFHVACFGACLELTDTGDNLAEASWWDDDEVRASTPGFYESAQFLADYFSRPKETERAK